MTDLNDPENLKEIERLRTLLSYNILDTPYEEQFDGLVQLISIISECPIAIISLIDEKRQWYKAKTGIELDEVPRKESFCQHTVLQDEMLEIPDAQVDERVKDNPHVIADDGIRFYAGVPLKAENGSNIGTVCVVDNKPKSLTEEQKKSLKLLTNQAMVLIEIHKKNQSLGNKLDDVLQKKIKEAEGKLQQKESEYNLLAKAIRKSSGVIEFSPEGIIHKVNQNFLDLVGYKKEELIGKHHNILLDDPEKQQSERFWKALRSGKYKSGRLRRIAKDGSEVWVQASYNPILDLNDNVQRIVKISQDITKEMNAEKALQEGKALAEALNIQKDHFIANVSHEIRTPIHAILGFTDLLLELENDEEKMTFLKSVKTAGDNLLFIINDILDLSKIEAGVIQMEHESFNLKKVVENVFSILHLKAHQKKLPFKFRIDQEVPERIFGDKNRLSQILINLLGNALKFTSEGSVNLYIHPLKKEGDSISLEFKIVDTGIGIPQDKLDSIFQRFSQAEENTSRKFGGTGLGLNISQLLIQKQNGAIRVESEEGKGSSFIFNLPFTIDHNEAAEEVETVAPVVEATKAGRILLCEDNELNQRLIKVILAEKGHTIDLAENGIKGFDFFKTKKYDLVLMDIQMPMMDGYQTTQSIREYDSEVPIIALTANFMLVERQKCLQMGMNDYLSKPFKKEDLLKKINYWISTGEKKQGSSKITEVPLPNFSTSLSFETLEELSGGNKEFEEEMIKLFLSQSESLLNEMTNFLKSKKLNELKSTAHKMKTSFGIIGADTSLLHKIEHNVAANTEMPQLEKTIEALKLQHQEIFLLLNQKLN